MTKTNSLLAIVSQLTKLKAISLPLLEFLQNPLGFQKFLDKTSIFYT